MTTFEVKIKVGVSVGVQVKVKVASRSNVSVLLREEGGRQRRCRMLNGKVGRRQRRRPNKRQKSPVVHPTQLKFCNKCERYYGRECAQQL